MPNEKRLNTVIDYIKSHLDEWYQANISTMTEYKTMYCFAGFGIQMFGTNNEKRMLHLNTLPRDEFTKSDRQFWIANGGPCMGGVLCFSAAQRIFGINKDEAFHLFKTQNTLEDLERIVDEITQ